METALVALLVLWAATYLFATLLPMRSRRVRGWLARHAEGRLPGVLVRRIRPGFPATRCGCGDGCAATRPDAVQ